MSVNHLIGQFSFFITQYLNLFLGIAKKPSATSDLLSKFSTHFGTIKHSQPYKIEIQPELVSTANLIIKHFDREELSGLCFQMGIDIDDLRAMGKAGKAVELVKLCQRQEKLSDLLMVCQKERPLLTWNHELTPNSNKINFTSSNDGVPSSIASTKLTIQQQPYILFNAYTLAFVVITFLIGFLLYSQIPSNIIESDNQLIITIMTVSVWIFFCCIIHVFCKLFNGVATIEQTLSIGLSLFAVTYVIACLITLLSIAIIVYLQSLFQMSDPLIIVDYLLIRVVTIVIYFPVALREIHEISWKRMAIVLVLLLMFYVSISSSSFTGTGVYADCSSAIAKSCGG